jgi:hypothetical protein
MPGFVRTSAREGDSAAAPPLPERRTARWC